MRVPQLQHTALRYFLEVVRGGSLTAASEQLHVASSAISRQIAGLEEALGTALFERQPRGMVATPAGEILAAFARKSGLEAEQALQDVAALARLRQGMVRVAATEGFASHFLPSAIVQFRRQFDQIAFNVSIEAPADISNRLREGDADIGLTFSRVPEKDIQVVYRQPSPILALMHPSHPLAQAKTLTLSRLSPYPIALPSANTTVRQMIDIACSHQQIQFQQVLSSNSVAVSHGFVLQGGGIAVAGEVSVRQFIKGKTMVAIPIRDKGMDLRSIELQTLAGRVLPHAAQSFLDFLSRYLASDTAHPGPSKRRRLDPQ